MKRAVLLTTVCVALYSITAIAQNNQLTDKEKSEGWVLLFDGKSFDGWRQYNGTVMPDFWSIDEEAMKVPPRTEKPPRERGVPAPSGDIIYVAKKFKNFELSIDWKIGKGGNSGVFYYVVETPDSQVYSSAPEVQLLDNWNAGDNKLANHLAGSLYDMRSALPSNAKPSDEWNTIVIRVKDGHVTHTQNGVKVVEYTLWTPEWNELVANSKFKDWPSFKEGPSKEGGYIGLQDHNDFGCLFRNIKIKEL